MPVASTSPISILMSGDSPRKDTPRRLRTRPVHQQLGLSAKNARARKKELAPCAVRAQEILDPQPLFLPVFSEHHAHTVVILLEIDELRPAFDVHAEPLEVSPQDHAIKVLAEYPVVGLYMRLGTRRKKDKRAIVQYLPLGPRASLAIAARDGMSALAGPRCCTPGMASVGRPPS
jgi:hypothetical protein